MSLPPRQAELYFYKPIGETAGTRLQPFLEERVMGLEPTTLILGRFCATIAPHPQIIVVCILPYPF